MQDIDVITDGLQPLPWTDAQRRDIEQECIEIIERECSINGYDITNIKLNCWAYILDTIHQEIFEKRPYLLRKYNQTQKNYKGIFIDDNVRQLYIIYKRLCNKYNCIIRKRHFYILSGIDANCVYNIGDRYKNASYINYQLQKELTKDSEESLVNSAVSDRGNPVKYIAILNHEHSWDKGGGVTDDTQRQAVSLSDLPKLQLSHNSNMIAAPDDSDDD